MIFAVAWPVGYSCQFPKSFEGWLGQHVFCATPAPVAFHTTGQVHSGVRPEVQHILERNDGQCGRRRPCQADQFPCDLVALAACAL